MTFKTITALLLSIVFLFPSCDMLLPFFTGDGGKEISAEAPIEFRRHDDIISTAIGDDLAFVPYNDNVPVFSEEDWNDGVYYIKLSDLDYLGRVGVVQGLFDYDHFPEDDREEIGSVTPTGWEGNNNKYDFVSAEYIYNRCHLLGFQFSGLNAEKRNLMTGTRFFNIDANLEYENIIADHLEEYNGDKEGEEMHQVLIRVTPDFYQENLVAHGEIYEADCMQCDDIDFAVYMFNKQPGVTIDYRTGENWANDGEEPIDPSTLPNATEYVYSRDSDTFHLPTCRYAKNISDENRVEIKAPYEWMVDTLNLVPCGTCKPYPANL